MRARDYGSSLADKTKWRANEANGSASMTIGNDTAEKADVWRRLSFYLTGIFRQSDRDNTRINLKDYRLTPVLHSLRSFAQIALFYITALYLLQDKY